MLAIIHVISQILVNNKKTLKDPPPQYISMLNFELSLAPVYFGGHGLNNLEFTPSEDACIVVSHTVASKFLRKSF